MQIEYLPILRLAAMHGKLVDGTLPYLEDRVRVRQQEPQIYGTQFSADCELYEIADAQNIDAIREEAGLIPLVDYVDFCRRQSSGQ